MLQISLVDSTFFIASISAIAFALIAIKVKDSVYAAISLGILGASIAVIISLLGFGYIAIFQLLIYVGATVTFVVFTVLTLGKVIGTLRNLKGMAIVNAIILGILVFLLSISVKRSANVSKVTSLIEIANTIISKYSFALMLIIISLVLLMIEGITLTRGETNGR